MKRITAARARRRFSMEKRSLRSYLLILHFDIKPEGGRFQQEDFAQITQMTSESHGRDYKYDLSYEEIGALIRQHIPAHRIETEKFFRLVLFNYIFSNGDAHLKNFSAIQTTQGDYVLTRGYDLLCTRIHSPGESDMALTLFKDGFSETYEAYGFYTYQDFLLFGQTLGIKNSRVEKIILEFAASYPLVKDLTGRSFLSEEFKKAYLDFYLDKIKRLKMISKA